MTMEERLIVSAYTGHLMCNFELVHEYIEKIMGRPVYTHEMSTEFFEKELRKKISPEFLKLCGDT